MRFNRSFSSSSSSSSSKETDVHAMRFFDDEDEDDDENDYAESAAALQDRLRSRFLRPFTPPLTSRMAVNSSAKSFLSVRRRILN